MPKLEASKNKETLPAMRLQNIEVAEILLKQPTNLDKPIKAFNFNISIDHKAVQNSNLFIVSVKVGVFAKDPSNIFGQITVVCFFEFADYNTVVTLDENNKASIPPLLTDVLNNISISTARGVMYSNFKGTFLQEAILPIIKLGDLKAE